MGIAVAMPTIRAFAASAPQTTAQPNRPRRASQTAKSVVSRKTDSVYGMEKKNVTGQKKNSVSARRAIFAP